MKSRINTILLLLCAMAFLMGCGHKGANIEDFNLRLYQPQYASGFEILGADGMQSSVIVSHSPWQGADDGKDTQLFIARNDERVPSGFNGQALKGDAKRIVCMSASHVALLDVVGNASKVVGVSGIDYVSNPIVQANRANIGDVGYDGNIDYERLASLDPDLVLLYGVNGASPMEPKLRELHIPYMYVGEYLEENPLGKAEWMVAVNEATGSRANAEEKFGELPESYNTIRNLVANVDSRPTVMVNTPYGDSWLMPSSQSYVAQLIRDAGAQLTYDKNTSNRSMPIDMEEAYLLTANADRWINVGQYDKLDDIIKNWPKFADTPVVVNHEVWNTTLRMTPNGGNEYWESSVVNPDRVLQDLVLIFHPETIPNGEFTYYKRL